ncbi:hypothetical protein CVT24_001526 [Panaeolus cyanescens]|uniref:Uncharacterized protein n=1 Tax=Panaeolus cyanescens TaxID=181874 RepID=A0A409YFB9_9AGAR|nr:hypothetical protein CVT24_001526 [Panaeolus cyanescens]
MENNYFAFNPVLVTPCNRTSESRQSSSLPSPNESTRQSGNGTLKVGRPHVHSLSSTQDILQHKSTIERIANAFAV